MEEPTTLWLVRHGQPADMNGRCYGRLDVGLSPDGVQQAKGVAKRLAGEPLTSVYSSPLNRATETARIVAEPHGLLVETVPGLAEIDFGDFEGLTYENIQARYPAAFQSWMDHPTETQFPNGESFAAMRKRVLSAIELVRARHRKQSIAVVAHSGVSRIIFAAALSIPPDQIFRLAQRHAAINKIEYFDHGAVVELMNG